MLHFYRAYGALRAGNGAGPLLPERWASFPRLPKLRPEPAAQGKTMLRSLNVLSKLPASYHLSPLLPSLSESDFRQHPTKVRNNKYFSSPWFHEHGSRKRVP